MNKSLEIAQRRKALGLSQTELARLVNQRSGKKISQQAIAKFESNPGARTWHLDAIQDVLSSLEGNSNANLLNTIKPFSDEEVLLITSYRALSDQQRRAVDMVLQGMMDTDGKAKIIAPSPAQGAVGTK